MMRATRGGVALGSYREQDQAALCSPLPPDSQDLPPLERHEPLADDKLALFPIAPTHLLAGVWQGPGTIAEMRRAEGRWP